MTLVEEGNIFIQKYIRENNRSGSSFLHCIEKAYLGIFWTFYWQYQSNSNRQTDSSAADPDHRL